MTRMRVVAFGLLAGCGPQVVEPADLDEVCEEKRPVRLLELEADELFFGVTETERIAERRILNVHYRMAGDTNFGPVLERSESWSVGMCGESPVKLDASPASLWEDAWPDVLLACREDTGELVAMDPLGERPSNVVARVPDCRGLQTPHGLVTFESHDEATGAVLLSPWVDDPWTETASPRVILDPIRAYTGFSLGPAGDMEVRDADVFAVTPSEELVRVSLVDTTLTTEATGVRDFEVSEDGRWLLWQDSVITKPDPSWAIGAVRLKDLTSGTTIELADASLAAAVTTPLRFIDIGVVVLQMGARETEPQRLFFVPDGGSISLAPGSIVFERLDDGRWLVGASIVGSWSLFEAGFEGSRLLFENEGLSRGWDEDGIEIIEVTPFDGAGLPFEEEAPVWFVPWDGERELLAGRAVQSYNRLAGDRIVTPVDVDVGAGWVGTFIVGAPEPDDERVIDERVLPHWSVHEDDEAIIYGVLDGERTGVWLTKLADTASR